jgi:branched-chain amino acid transport system substrate-binding protein
MRNRHLCALAVMIAGVLSGPVAADITIGFANPLSGAYAATGGRNRAAVAQAVADLNARGGVLGQPLRLIAADDACGLEQAVTAARKLVAAGVRLVVGHMCSHASLMAAGLYEAFDILMISPDSTHPRLTEEGRRNVFRLVGRDDRQGALAGDFLARAYRGRNIAILHDGSVYGRGLAAQTRLRLRQLGVVETLHAAYSPGEPRYDELAVRLGRHAIDVLYVGGYGADAGAIVRSAREQGNDLKLVGGDALGAEEFWTAAGEAGEGTIFSARPAIRRHAAAAAVRAALRGRGPGPGGIAAYAAVEVWAQAVERAGTAALAPVATQLRRGRFQSVLGQVAFDPKGDLRGAGWEMQVWSDGDHAPLDRRIAASPSRAIDTRPAPARDSRKAPHGRMGRVRQVGSGSWRHRAGAFMSSSAALRMPSRCCSSIAGASRAPPSSSSSIASLRTTASSRRTFPASGARAHSPARCRTKRTPTFWPTC